MTAATTNPITHSSAYELASRMADAIEAAEDALAHGEVKQAIEKHACASDLLQKIAATPARNASDRIAHVVAAGVTARSDRRA